jgi:radical SAM superfamily enzyme YgiQ (UPF0313 family)
MQCGISYISSLLKKHGHNTRLVILSRVFYEKSKAIIDAYLKKFYPKLICLSTISSEYRFIKDMAQYIKNRYPDIFLLVGGAHISLNPGEALSGAFDAVCIGEGEYPTLELAGQLQKGVSPSGIPNLWIKRGSEIEKNPTRPFLQDLDSLPFPDRDIWEEWIEEPLGARYVVLAGRGCPFVCSYCCNHALRKLARGAYIRLRSPDNILEEIKKVSDKYPSRKEIYIEVETIGLNMKWIEELCSKLERFNATLDQPLIFGGNLRITPNTKLESLFAMLQRANFKFINIGLESGSERIRREVLNRHYSNQDVINAVRVARQHGFKISLFNLFGVPGETIDDFKKTVEMNRICLPDRHFTSIFCPYPGTKLYTLCKEQNLLKGDDYLDMKFIEKRNAILDLPGFPKKEIQKNYIWFNYHVYRGHKPIYKLLAHVLRAKLETSSRLNYLYRKLTRVGVFKWLKKKLTMLKKY